MAEFTSTILNDLLLRVVARVDPDLLAGLSGSDPFSAAVEPAGFKRELVSRVLASRGPGLLLSVGQHLDLAQETPTVTVLRQSAGPAVMAEKWMRLERYHHASNRTRIEPVGQEGWRCTRYSVAAPPTLGENCLIAGLLLGLAGLAGARDCRLQLEGAEFRADDLAAAALPAGASLETFRILWSPTGADPGSRDRAPVLAEEMVPDRIADLFARDIARSWKLAPAAAALGMSTRSLQRRLREDGRSFSSLLRRERLREATRLLTATPTPLAEIGYCCGYADQAHFQREFKRVTNITPGAFRAIAASGETAAPGARRDHGFVTKL